MRKEADQGREARLRRLSKKHNLHLRKSRVRTPNVDNMGGYMLVDPQHNALVFGSRWDLDLDDVDKYLTWFSSDTGESYAEWLKSRHPGAGGEENA